MIWLVMYGYPQIGIARPRSTAARAPNAPQFVYGYPQSGIDPAPERTAAPHGAERRAPRVSGASRARCVYGLGNSRGASRAVCGAPVLSGEPLEKVVPLRAVASLPAERVDALGHAGVCLALDEEPLPTTREVRGELGVGHGKPRGLLEARGAQYGTPFASVPSVASTAPSKAPCGV